MDILHIYGTISAVERKSSKTGKTFFVYTIDGKKMSSFNDLEISVGDKGRMTYKVNGQYNNAVGFIPGDGVEIPSIYPPEEVEDSPVASVVKKGMVEPFDSRRREITLGQASNLALQYINASGGPALISSEYDDHFVAMSKRFFRLLEQLQKELL